MHYVLLLLRVDFWYMAWLICCAWRANSPSDDLFKVAIMKSMRFAAGSVSCFGRGRAVAMTWVVDETILAREFYAQFETRELIKRKFLVLEGPAGFGKSKLAMAISKYFGGGQLIVTCWPDGMQLRSLEHYDRHIHRTLIFIDPAPELVYRESFMFIGLLQTPVHMMGPHGMVDYSPPVFWNHPIIICAQLWTDALKEMPRDQRTYVLSHCVHFRFDRPYHAEWVPHLGYRGPVDLDNPNVSSSSVSEQPAGTETHS
jgi:hypothetical protein